MNKAINFSTDSLCMIIQGPTNSKYLKKVQKKYKKSNIPLIFSTWKGEESKFKKKDLVLFNEVAEATGVQNIMLQQLSTYNGLLEAKKLGYKYAIKIRSDMVFTNIEKFLKLDIDYNKLNFLYFINHLREDHNFKHYKYLCDYIQISSIDNLLNLWNFKNDINCTFAEELLTNNFLNSNNIDNISFFGSMLSEECDIFWFKNNLYLSELRFDKKYKSKIII